MEFTIKKYIISKKTTEWVGVVVMLDLFRRCLVQISGREAAIPTEVSCDFPQSLQENAKIAP
jgi:hypothetical protein